MSTSGGRELELAQRPAHAALGLPALVGQRPVAVVGPTVGIAVAGVGVADEKQEHGSASIGGVRVERAARVSGRRRCPDSNPCKDPAGGRARPGEGDSRHPVPRGRRPPPGSRYFPRPISTTMLSIAMIAVRPGCVWWFACTEKVQHPAVGPLDVARKGVHPADASVLGAHPPLERRPDEPAPERAHAARLRQPGDEGRRPRDATG